MNELPAGWTTTTLGSLCLEMRNGISAKPDQNEGLPILRISAVRAMKLDDSDTRFLPLDFNGAATYKLREDDLLFTRYNGNRELVGACVRVGKLTSDLVYPDKLIRVRLRKELVYPGFVERAANTAAARAFVSEKLKTSAGQVGVSGADLKLVPLRIAPLAEQKRIADKLDAVLARVDACRERLDCLPGILKRFRLSVLAAATSGALTEEWRSQWPDAGQWREVSLGDIADIQGGVTKDAKKQSLADAEVPYLRVANVQRGYIDLKEVKTIRVPAEKLRGLLLKPGDVLFNEGGDIDKLGRGWVWEGQVAQCTFQNHVFRARLHDGDDEPKYVSWWGNSRGLDYFLRAGKQTTNLASINKSVLGSLPISLPLPLEQAEIVRRVESFFAWADRLEARHAAACAQVERLTPSLLAKAFRGELVPQDAGDESASELLKRLTQERPSKLTVPMTRQGAKPRRASPSQTASNVREESSS